MKRFTLSCLTAVALLTGSLGLAHAGECYSLKKVVCYEPYCVYETRYETYTKYVTKYDECGKPYTVAITCRRPVTVAVKKVREVVKYIKVYH